MGANTIRLYTFKTSQRHGYFLDAIGLSGETVYTQPTSGGGFMSCSFTDYSWESVTDTAATLAAIQTAVDTLVASGR